MSESKSDSDDSGDVDEPTFPNGVDALSDPDRFITHGTHKTKHAYSRRNGEFRSACGSHTVDLSEADEMEVVNARELLLAHVLEGDDGIDVKVCQRCRQSAELDKYVSPETLRDFVEGKLDGGAQSAVPEIEAEYIPVQLSLDAEIKIPANERAYRLLEAVGKAAAKQTAVDRQDTIAVEGEVIDDDSDDEP